MKTATRRKRNVQKPRSLVATRRTLTPNMIYLANLIGHGYQCKELCSPGLV
jgi:hypothetical protein